MFVSAAVERNQITLVFIANCVSPKCDEIQNDIHVNVSFYDEKTTHWASYSGIARVSQDKALIDKHWSSMCVLLPLTRIRADHCPRTSAWFGDLGDGIHKGDQNDPRVAVIEVIPDEVRYWLSTANIATKMADIVASAVTGKVAAPGQLVTLTHDEVCLSCIYARHILSKEGHRSNSSRAFTQSNGSLTTV